MAWWLDYVEREVKFFDCAEIFREESSWTLNFAAVFCAGRLSGCGGWPINRWLKNRIVDVFLNNFCTIFKDLNHFCKMQSAASNFKKIRFVFFYGKKHPDFEFCKVRTKKYEKQKKLAQTQDNFTGFEPSSNVFCHVFTLRLPLSQTQTFSLPVLLDKTPLITASDWFVIEKCRWRAS